MIIEQLFERENFTDTDNAIASYLLDKEHDIHNLTSSELGKKSYTSQSAVVRFYKKLGLKNYQEFITILVLERNEYYKYNNDYEQQPHLYFTGIKDTENVLKLLYSQAIDKTNVLLNSNVITRVCNRISSANIVDVYGMGIAASLSMQMTYKLQSLGIYSISHHHLNRAYIDGIKEKNTHVSIFFILSEQDEDWVKEIEYLLSKHMYVVVIMKNSIKLKLSEVDKILFHSHAFADIDSIYSLFAGEYIINLIYSTLIYRKQTMQVLNKI